MNSGMDIRGLIMMTLVNLISHLAPTSGQNFPLVHDKVQYLTKAFIFLSDGNLLDFFLFFLGFVDINWKNTLNIYKLIKVLADSVNCTHTYTDQA